MDRTKNKADVSLFENESEAAWTEAEEKAVRRKLDLNLVPILTLMYLVCFIDRTNIGNAKIQGMSKDLDLVGVRFNYVLTAFYVAYAVIELPSNMMLKRVGAKRWLPFLTVCFGIVCMSTAFARTFPQLMVLRVLLGLTEGGMMPGTSFYLSCFYKREELLFRIGVFATSASLAGAFGGLLASALIKVPRWGAKGSELYGWRNIFFFEGLLTLFIGMGAPYFLPRGITDCKFLSDRQRFIAEERLARAQQGDVHAKVTRNDIIHGFFNINNQLCAFGFACANVAVQSISLFMPTILRQMGYTAISAQLYSVPPYVCACVLAICAAFASDKTRQRGVYIVLFASMAVVGYAILRTSNDNHTKYGAVFIVAIGAFPNGPAFLSWGINNAGTAGGRAFASGYIMSIGTLGAIVATWTYVEKDQPRYKMGHSINLGSQAILILLAAGCTIYCYSENRIRDAGKRDKRLDGLGNNEEANLGYRHPGYRYMT